jgi:hypothetical protein
VSEKALSFTEFLELMLARIAEADRKEPGTWINMFPLAAELRANVPDDWVFDAREALENRGLVSPLKVMGRTAPARLTGEGRLYVERGGDTGVIDDYRQHPWNFVVVSGTGHQVAVGVEGDVQQASVQTGLPNEVWDLLREIEVRLTADDSLDQGPREEALSDVQMARAQLERAQPNRRAALALLDPLAKFASVGTFVAKLVALLA